MKYIGRKVFNRLIAAREKSRILILIGSRQVGKTTLIKEFQQYLESKEEKCIYFSMEKPSSLEIFSLGYENVIDYLTNRNILNNRKKLTIFIDEMQYIPNVSGLFKAIYDLNENIYIVGSGSSSLEIKKNLEESLAGRKQSINIYPLSFSEYLLFKNADIKNIDDLDIEKTLGQSIVKEYNKYFDEFVLLGGMPAVALENSYDEKRILLNEVYSTYIEKDIKGILKNERVPVFNMFFKILASQSSQLLNIEEVSNKLRQARPKIEEELYILEETFINFLLPPFYTNKRKELIKNKKTFFYDTGMRNQSINNFASLDYRQDRGLLIETAIFNEINKNRSVAQDIFFYRTRNGTEIDFIIKKDADIYPIEVKVGRSNKIPRSFYNFIQRYNVKKAFVLNRDNLDIKRVNDCKIYFLPHFLAYKIL